LKINRIERLKLLDLTMMVSTMTNTMNQVMSVTFFYLLKECGIVAQYTCKGHLVKMVC